GNSEKLPPAAVPALVTEISDTAPPERLNRNTSFAALASAWLTMLVAVDWNATNCPSGEMAGVPEAPLAPVVELPELCDTSTGVHSPPTLVATNTSCDEVPGRVNPLTRFVQLDENTTTVPSRETCGVVENPLSVLGGFPPGFVLSVQPCVAVPPNLLDTS